MTVPAKRVGLPISVKLIAVTSVLIAVAIGGATWFSQRSIEMITRDQIDQRAEAGRAAIQRESELIVQAVAQAVSLPLSQSQYPDIRPILDEAMRGDRDHLIVWMVVQDQTKQTVSSTDHAPDKLPAPDPSAGVFGATIYSGKTAVGELRIGVTTQGLERDLATSLERAHDTAVSTRNRVWLVSAAVLAIGIVLVALFGIRLARPIKSLTQQASRIAGGDLTQRVPEGRRDELGVLAHTFNFMTDEIIALLHEQKQKASLEKEMELARAVQQAMLPPQTLDEHGAMKVVGYCMPASSCGGDWWMYRKLPSGRMLLVLGDATGHGIHSAMIAATARGAVEALASDDRPLAPDQVLRAIDHAIRQLGEHNILMTAFAAVFDANTGVLQYANAGQNFPYVIALGPDRVLGTASIIAASGNPLGDRHIATEIRRGSQQLDAGSLFVCFTDGVVERANPAGKLFGDRRLRSTLMGKKLANGDELVALRDLLVRALDTYAEGQVADDDITFVLCHYDPPAMRAKGVA